MDLEDWLILLGLMISSGSVSIILYQSLPMMIQYNNWPFWYKTAIDRTIGVIGLMGLTFFILGYLGIRDRLKEDEKENLKNAEVQEEDH